MNLEILDNSEPRTDTEFPDTFKHQYDTIGMYRLLGDSEQIGVFRWFHLVPPPAEQECFVHQV